MKASKSNSASLRVLIAFFRRFKPTKRSQAGGASKRHVVEGFDMTQSREEFDWVSLGYVELSEKVVERDWLNEKQFLNGPFQRFLELGSDPLKSSSLNNSPGLADIA